MGLFSGIVGKLASVALAPLGPVGAAVGGAVVSGLVDRQSQKRQNEAIDRANDMALERETTQFERMRDAALRAGFNPLTVLRSGMFQQAGLLSRQAETWKGSLLGGVSNAIINAPQLRLDREMRDLERREREINIEYTGALASSVLDSMYRRNEVGTGFNPSNPDNRRDVVYNSQTNPFGIGSDNQFTAPWIPDAEAYEQRYGDIAQEAGIFTVEADIAYNDGLRQVSERSGRSMAELDQIIRNSNDPLFHYNEMLAAAGVAVWTRPSTWPNWFQ